MISLENAAMQLLRSNPNLKNNPMLQNAISLAKSGNASELESIARNIAKAKGIDCNELMQKMGFKR